MSSEKSASTCCGRFCNAPVLLRSPQALGSTLDHDPGGFWWAATAGALYQRTAGETPGPLAAGSGSIDPRRDLCLTGAKRTQNQRSRATYRGKVSIHSVRVNPVAADLCAFVGGGCSDGGVVMTTTRTQRGTVTPDIRGNVTTSLSTFSTFGLLRLVVSVYRCVFSRQNLFCSRQAKSVNSFR